MVIRVATHQVRKLCHKKKLSPPVGKMKTNAFYYGKYEGSTLTAILGVSLFILNRTPGSLAISIDLVASIDTTHVITKAFETLKKLAARRKFKSVIFAQAHTGAVTVCQASRKCELLGQVFQVAQTDSARDFWQGARLCIALACLIICSEHVNHNTGKLTKTKRASIMPILVSSFDPTYRVYEDTEDMAIFFN